VRAADPFAIFLRERNLRGAKRIDAGDLSVDKRTRTVASCGSRSARSCSHSATLAPAAFGTGSNAWIASPSSGTAAITAGVTRT
jgi:hypothetical protein